MTPATTFTCTSPTLLLDCSTWSVGTTIARGDELARWVRSHPQVEQLRVCLSADHGLRPLRSRLQVIGCTVVSRARLVPSR